MYVVYAMFFKQTQRFFYISINTGTSVTVSLSVAAPYALVHRNVKVVSASIGNPLLVLDTTEPEATDPAATDKLRPFWPVNVQPVAPLVVQLSVVEPPLRTRVGSAERDTVG
jgi:hypothetical protein